MEKTSTFKERLKEALSDCGMSQAELARSINTDRSNLSHWLSGRSDCRYDTLKKMANILNVSVAWLEGYDVPKKGEVSYFYEKIELLNDEGKRKVEVYIDDLLDNPKYSKLPAVKLPKLNIA